MRSGVTSSTGWPSWVGRNPALWCPEREVGKAPPLAPQLNHATAPHEGNNVGQFVIRHGPFAFLKPADGRNRPPLKVAQSSFHCVGRQAMDVDSIEVAFGRHLPRRRPEGLPRFKIKDGELAVVSESGEVALRNKMVFSRDVHEVRLPPGSRIMSLSEKIKGRNLSCPSP